MPGRAFSWTRGGSTQPVAMSASWRVYSRMPHPRGLCFVQASACDVHLIVVQAIRGHRQFMQIVGEPGGLTGQVDEPILDRCGLRVKPHDLVAVRFVARRQRGRRGAPKNKQMNADLFI
jgi:hypothetical protein